MSDSIRLNKYRALYRGPVKPTSTPALKTRAASDRVALRYIRERPEIYDITNLQTQPPRNFHMPVQRHRHPPHITPMHNYNKYVRGSSQYNQAVQSTIRDLSRLMRTA